MTDRITAQVPRSAYIVCMPSRETIMQGARRAQNGSDNVPRRAPKLCCRCAIDAGLNCRRLRRAWNDRDNVSWRIPKSWDEALAHPTLRSLTLRSSRRYVNTEMFWRVLAWLMFQHATA